MNIEISRDASKAQLQQIIRVKVSIDSVIHSDDWYGYDGLVDVGHEKHFRVHHGKNEFVRGYDHINGIESFYSYVKKRLAMFNGIASNMFYLHLKEVEFRFNHKHRDLYAILLLEFRKNLL